MSQLPQRALGHSGIEVPVVGLGCNNFGRRLDLEATRAVVDEALEQGVTFFDTADIYGDGRSEEFLGRLLEGRRDQVILATKFGMGDSDIPQGSRDYVVKAVERSLRSLRTETIDVYWYHRPDGVTPIAETLEALDDLVRDGRVRAIGASNFSVEQIEEADRVAADRRLTRFVAIQNEYSLIVRDPEQDVLPACEERGLSFVPYFPLASGLLTGKYRRGSPAPPGTRLASREQAGTDEQFALVEALERFAQEHSRSLLEVAIGGLLMRPVVTSVIAGATKPEQVRQNAAAGRWEPTPEEVRDLRAVLEQR